MTASSKYRTVLVHNQNTLLLNMLHDGLNRCDMFSVKTCMGDLPDLATAVAKHRPAVLLIEPRPDAEAIDEIARSVEDWLPGCVCVGYLPSARRNGAHRCLEAGFGAVVSHESDLTVVIQALTVTLQNGVFVDRPFVRPEASADEGLSQREWLVLQQLARGFSDKEIAGRLNLSAKTVQTYKHRGLRKLGFHRKHQVVEYAINNDWLS
ncbi:helix-turn-helix transcriptional regulator [Jannaschia formosa]|uniref:helix-turn-helix transcriptional regulator n=1 Tax=Jannaschia formosa TaxID=2259592 RepID=UPI000E1B6174|nr:response regulator transcription factor [Jannaschia formosa]TFL16179.1 response regulator transcription factor [Jannaschia formosa]